MTSQEAPTPEIRHLTFRSSRIIYYGPHACGNCGVLICKMSHEQGGNSFVYPSGPIYPNTEWHPHVCDPKLVAKYEGLKECTQVPPPIRMYSDNEVRAILRKAQERGLNLDEGSPIEKLTIAEPDEMLA